MARLLNITAGLIYVLWLVLGAVHLSGRPSSEAMAARPVLAGAIR